MSDFKQRPTGRCFLLLLTIQGTYYILIKSSDAADTAEERNKFSNCNLALLFFPLSAIALN